MGLAKTIVFPRVGLPRCCYLLATCIAMSLGGCQRVGMQYWTWFDNDPGGQGCAGGGWRDRPFELDGVQALTFPASPDGYCYSSLDPSTATQHAQYLDDLGVDFVIFDETNFSKVMPPESNPSFRADLAAMDGFRAYPRHRIRTVFMLSITCWAEQCHGREGDRTEVFTYNENIRKHIEAIAEVYRVYPKDAVLIDGRPVLLFYIHQGSSVQRLDGDYAFHGPGNIAPTSEEFNPAVTVGGEQIALRSVFSVRFAAVAADTFDYTPYSTEVWPFVCNTGQCSFAEAGFATVFAPLAGPRSLELFERGVEDAKGKPFLIIHGWNQFSSTDEHGGNAMTLEPNTQLHKHDTTPGNQDPWFFYNGVRDILRRVR